MGVMVVIGWLMRWGRGGSDVVGRFGFMVTMRSLTTKLREKLEILRFCEARAKRSSN